MCKRKTADETPVAARRRDESSAGSGAVVPCMAVLLCHLMTGCDRQPGEPGRGEATVPGAPWFEDITASSGVSFVHQTPAPARYAVPDQMGSGAAWFDYDQDGRLDLYLVQNAGPRSGASNQLFHQEADGRFKNVSAGSGLDVAGYGMGVAVGDVNNDGAPDILLTEYGGVRLFVNQRQGRFEDQTAAAGLDNPRWATAAAFFDYDRDGWLDLVVANYLDYDPTQACTDAKGAPEFCGPHGFPGLATRLFHHRGAGLRFDDVSVSSGVALVPGPALGVLCADFDGDGWPDIFLADDGRPNRLFLNRRDGTFAEEAGQRGLAYNALGQTAGNMGIAIGDVDGNGFFDLFVTHLSEEQHALWTQSARGFFQDQTGPCGLSGAGWRGTGFGAVLADFDLDGALDLAWVNGLVKRGQAQGPVVAGLNSFWAPYAQRAQLFANTGGGRFRDRSAAEPALCGPAMVGRGLAAGDVDNDGAVDLLVTSTGGPARLCRNVAPRRGHWLSVRAIDPAAGGRDAYGAEILLRAANRRWWGLVQPGCSYLCSADPRVHFGLGPARTVESIQVRWPDGAHEEFPPAPTDRAVLLSKGSGKVEGR